MPRDVAAALAALAADDCLRAAFGPFFVDYFARLKQSEIDRLQFEVTAWEQAEIF